jgi:hypothetical protein
VPGSGPLTIAPNDSVATSAWTTCDGGPANPQDLKRMLVALLFHLRRVLGRLCVQLHTVMS